MNAKSHININLTVPTFIGAIILAFNAFVMAVPTWLFVIGVILVAPAAILLALMLAIGIPIMIWGLVLRNRFMRDFRRNPDGFETGVDGKAECSSGGASDAGRSHSPVDREREGHFRKTSESPISRSVRRPE